MAKNLRRGSKVEWILDPRFPKTKRQGKVTAKWSVRKNTKGIPNNRRSMVQISSDMQVFIKYPHEVKRIKNTKLKKTFKKFK